MELTLLVFVLVAAFSFVIGTAATTAPAPPWPAAAFAAYLFWVVASAAVALFVRRPAAQRDPPQAARGSRPKGLKVCHFCINRAELAQVS
uniref:Uncharacterized protein n=3 Tax=Oryza TaxID=4527 RepID=A0A0D9YMR7_9ORYZ